MSNLKYKHTAYTSAQWASLNPVIVENEIVIESDTKRTKIGNGISTYNELEYADANSINEINDALGRYIDINVEEVQIAGGIWTPTIPGRGFYIIKVFPGQIIEITATEIFYYTFLSDYTGVTILSNPYFCNGYSDRVVSSANSITLKVPADAKYLYLFYNILNLYSSIKINNIIYKQGIPISLANIRELARLIKLNRINAKGNKVSIIGDSISSYEGYNPLGFLSYYPRAELNVTTVTDTWWNKLLTYLGAELEINASFSGSGATEITIEGIVRNNFYSRANVETIGNPDIVIVELGTNDSGESKTIGNVYNFQNAIYSLSETEFCDAYIKGIKALQQIPSVSLIVCLILDMDDKYANAIIDIANYYGLQYIDARGYEKMEGFGPHPNSIGMTSIYNKVLSDRFN